MPESETQAATPKTQARKRSPRKSVRVKAVEKVARGYFDAVADRDAAAMAAFWAQDGVDDVVPVGVLRGPEGVRSFFADLFAALPDLELVVEGVRADADGASVQWRLRGSFDGQPFLGIDPTGRTLEIRGVDVLEVGEDELIHRNTAYYDGAAFARDIGMLPGEGSGADRALRTAFNGVTKLRKTVEGLR